MRAWNPKGSGNGIQYQDTKYLYESPFDGSFATSTIYPDSADTTSSGTDQVKTQYDRLGRVTQTTDQNGTVHQFEYDGAGRFLADNVATLGTNIDSAVRRIERSYDDVGRVSLVTSRSGSNAAAAIVNQIKYAYDGWGNVIRSQQAHGGLVNDLTPSVRYTYADGASGSDAKYVRLASVAYPGGNRSVYYLYGSTDGISDMLSRVASIADASSSGTDYVHYDYIGTDRIVKITHDGAGSNGLSLSYGSGGTYAGWDRFGRIVQKLWKDAALSGGSYDGYVYTYDRNSNVKTKANWSTGGNPGNLDETYAYDGLNRLLEARRGTSSSNLIANPDKLTDWTLDSLGNWADSLGVNSPTGGDATTDGNVNFTDLSALSANYGSSDSVRWRDGDFNGDGSVSYPDLTTLSANYGSSGGNVGTLQTRATNAANEITSVSGSWVTPTYDAAGNMVSAPKAGAETTRLWYVYDAWNRQVIVKNDSSGSPGSTLATYSYDGLNRRVTKDISGGATFDDYFNENWQRLESRKNGDANPLDQFLWDLTYIDTPVLRWHDANTDGDLADLSSGNPGPTYDNTLYYTTDANHNITALYDADQERVIERYVYDPYGKTFVYDRIWAAISSSAVDNDVQWEGYVSDVETGNKLARNRPYNVPLATWYVRDFEGYIDGNNLYQAVRSNPLNHGDPFGLDSGALHEADKNPAPQIPPCTCYPGPIDITDVKNQLIDRGYDFSVKISMFVRGGDAPDPGKDCTLEWWEWGTNPVPWGVATQKQSGKQLPAHAVPADSWTELYSRFHSQEVKIPSMLDSWDEAKWDKGTKRVTIIDKPRQEEKPGAIGIRWFAIRVKAGAGAIGFDKSVFAVLQIHNKRDRTFYGQGDSYLAADPDDSAFQRLDAIPEKYKEVTGTSSGALPIRFISRGLPW